MEKLQLAIKVAIFAVVVFAVLVPDRVSRLYQTGCKEKYPISYGYKYNVFI